ncbi:hypothetical protein RJD23_00935 [Buchnera aphidicola (Ceratoglyphina bambusae)]|uniref:hypothetical protein n=1 Tax=Buchnera aphidicola TaxID=9 RepID=UPI0031B82BB2
MIFLLKKIFFLLKISIILFKFIKEVIINLIVLTIVCLCIYLYIHENNTKKIKLYKYDDIVRTNYIKILN